MRPVESFNHKELLALISIYTQCFVTVTDIGTDFEDDKITLADFERLVREVMGRTARAVNFLAEHPDQIQIFERPRGQDQ